jgi:hypothetical protein
LITRNFDITVRIPEQDYIPVCFQVVQNDKSVYGLTIHLTDGINEISYGKVTSATITFAKADGHVVQGNMTVGASSLTYTMGTNEIAYPGSVMASIQLFGPAGERLTSARFRFDVVGDLITPSAVQSTSQFPLLQQMLADIEQLKTDIVNLQVPNNSLLDTKLSDAAGQIKARFTTHLAETVSKQVYASRAVGVTGTQHIVLGFKPKNIIITARIAATKVFSNGSCDQNLTQGHTASWTTGYYGGDNNILSVYDGGSNAFEAAVISIDDDGFTLNWVYSLGSTPPVVGTIDMNINATTH